MSPHDPTNIDESVIIGDSICGDCGAVPGAHHMPGCDVERCGCHNGGQQAISCGECDDESYWQNRIRWTGEWHGKKECRHHGFYCHTLVDGEPVEDPSTILPAQQAGAKVQWYVPCDKGDIGAHEDLNRWHSKGCPGISEEP